MLRFECDYCEGAHPRILEALARTNLEQWPGYGADDYCASAAAKIRDACKAPQAAVHFVSGGTQANLCVLAAGLRAWQGVAAAQAGHIQGHEAGSIEATGHKVLPMPGRDGRVDAAQLRQLCADTAAEYTVHPGMVYLSHPAENGTLYTLAELQAIRAVCDEYGLLLFLDGARLAYGLAAQGSDVDLPALARLCDVFYIGGTKVGALLGEAIVIPNPVLGAGFRRVMKQRGAVLAKGRVLGIQFDTLFTDGLYLQLGAHADQLAMQLRDACREKGLQFLCESPTNQQFPIFPREALARLRESYSFEPMGAVDAQREAVRICTGWATTQAAVDALCADIRAL